MVQRRGLFNIFNCFEITDLRSLWLLHFCDGNECGSIQWFMSKIKKSLHFMGLGIKRSIQKFSHVDLNIDKEKIKPKVGSKRFLTKVNLINIHSPVIKYYLSYYLFEYFITNYVFWNFDSLIGYKNTVSVFWEGVITLRIAFLTERKSDSNIYFHVFLLIIYSGIFQKVDICLEV